MVYVFTCSSNIISRGAQGYGGSTPVVYVFTCSSNTILRL